MRYLIPLLILLAGCKDPQTWAGTWRGAVKTSTVCDLAGGGQTEPKVIEEEMRLDIEQSGALLRWPTDCGTAVVASIAGDSATIGQHSCPPTAGSSGQTLVMPTWRHGALRRSGESLIYSESTESMAIVAGGAFKCHGELSATLRR